MSATSQALQFSLLLPSQRLEEKSILRTSTKFLSLWSPLLNHSPFRCVPASVSLGSDAAGDLQFSLGYFRRPGVRLETRFEFNPFSKAARQGVTSINGAKSTNSNFVIRLSAFGKSSFPRTGLRGRISQVNPVPKIVNYFDLGIKLVLLSLRFREDSSLGKEFT